MLGAVVSHKPVYVYPDILPASAKAQQVPRTSVAAVELLLPVFIPKPAIWRRFS